VAFPAKRKISRGSDPEPAASSGSHAKEDFPVAFARLGLFLLLFLTFWCFGNGLKALKQPPVKKK